MRAKINKLLAKLGKAIIFARGIFVKRIYEKFSTFSLSENLVEGEFFAALKHNRAALDESAFEQNVSHSLVMKIRVNANATHRPFLAELFHEGERHASQALSTKSLVERHSVDYGISRIGTPLAANFRIITLAVETHTQIACDASVHFQRVSISIIDVIENSLQIWVVVRPLHEALLALKRLRLLDYFVTSLRVGFSRQFKRVHVFSK